MRSQYYYGDFVYALVLLMYILYLPVINKTFCLRRVFFERDYQRSETSLTPTEIRRPQCYII